jgi:hypothetical protein
MLSRLGSMLPIAEGMLSLPGMSRKLFSVLLSLSSMLPLRGVLLSLPSMLPLGGVLLSLPSMLPLGGMLPASVSAMLV